MTQTSLSTTERQVRPSDGPFLKTDAVVGQLYMKIWRAPFVHGVNELWAQRCAEWWARHGLRHGVVWSDHRNAYDPLTETITTYATPLHVLPGRRYDARERPSRADG